MNLNDMEGMNIFEQFDFMLCKLVLDSKNEKERLVAVVTRETYQAAMKHINDKALLGPTTTPENSHNRVIALVKAAAFLAGMAAALSVPGGDKKKLAEFWKWFMDDANGAQEVITKGMLATMRAAFAEGDRSAGVALEMIGKIGEKKS